jgi:hypothetical protein
VQRTPGALPSYRARLPSARRLGHWSLAPSITSPTPTPRTRCMHRLRGKDRDLRKGCGSLTSDRASCQRNWFPCCRPGWDERKFGTRDAILGLAQPLQTPSDLVSYPITPPQLICYIVSPSDHGRRRERVRIQLRSPGTGRGLMAVAEQRHTALRPSRPSK